MSNKSYITEIILLLITAVLLVLLLNPFSFYMPTAVMMLVLGVVTVAFGAFCFFIFSEKGRDEREKQHIQVAGRIAFLTAGGAALLGLFVQTLGGEIDPWLVAVVGAMVVGKIGSLVYERRQH